ncbi:MAG: transcriptional regulator [Herbinix sp.]|jgi:hypothetical protein|nr:transcriptional regulator [Herbinix sp.]
MYNFDDFSMEEIKQGYYYDTNRNHYICMTCGKTFEDGEIYPIDNRFFEAYRAVQLHLEQSHGDRLKSIIVSGNKYISVTEKQLDLLLALREGLTDQEIAAKLSISASTVRHQKFMFREKAKQAKMYLSIYDLAMEKVGKDKDTILPIHDSATMVDDRYITTKEENDKILASLFESLSPLKLKTFSTKEKKKIVILRKIMEQFKKGMIYTENEVNQILKTIYSDYPTMRRYLIEYGFMDRSTDCTQYWVK